MRTSNLDKVLDQVTEADCQQAAEELERYLDAGLTATRELLTAFLNDLNDECWLDGAPAVTAARQPAFLHHPTRTTRSAGWRHSCAAVNPPRCRTPVVGTSTAAASRQSSAATKGNGTHQLVLLPLPGWA